VESVFHVELEAGQLGRSVVQGVGDEREAGIVTVDGEAQQLGIGELERRPGEGDGCLSYVEQLEIGRLWLVGAVRGQDGFLQ
jgi:hypothetical protein